MQENENAVKLCDTVLEYVPEFRNYKDFSVWGDNGKSAPYSHFGVFGRFIVEQIENFPDTADVTKRIFDFINDAYNNSEDPYIHTMVGTEILENLTVSEKMRAVAKKYLRNGVLEHFMKTLNS